MSVLSEVFAEGQAIRLSYSRNQKTGQRELNRGWACSIDSKEADAQDTLAAMTYVDNPKANKRTYPGRWRVVTTGWTDNGQKFFQMLRHGWATSVLSDDNPNEECRISQGLDKRSDDRSLTFSWHSIAASSVKACLDELQAARDAGGFVSPSVQGETKSGRWAIADITTQQTEDGSYIISAQGIKVSTIKKIEDLAALTPLREYVRDINNPFGLEGGYATAAPKAGRKPTEGIALAYRALSVSSRAVLEALGDDALLALLSNAEKAKYKTIKAKVEDDVGNTLKFSVEFEYIPLRTTTPEDDARYVDLKRSNQSGKLVLTRSWDRIDPAYAKDLLTSNDLNPNVTALTVTGPKADGKIYPGIWMARSTEAPMTNNDGVRIVQELILSGDADIDVYVGSDPDHGSYTKYLFEASETAVNAFLAATTFPETNRPAGFAKLNPAWNTPEIGITKTVQISHNADSSLNLVAFYSSAANLQHIELVTTPLEVSPGVYQSESRAWGWNIAISNLKTYSDAYKAIAYESGANPNVNIKRTFSIRRRDEHTFDFEGTITTLTSEYSGKVVEEYDANKIVTRWTAKRLNPFVAADNTLLTTIFADETSQTKGTICKLKKELDPELGSWNCEKIKIQERDQQSSSGSNSAVETVTIDEHTAAENEASAAAAGANSLSEAKNEKTETGLNKTFLKTTTKLPIDSGEVLVEQNALLAKTLKVLLNQTTIPAAGDNEKVNAKPNGLGGWDIEKIKIQERDQQSSSGSNSAVETVTIVEHTAAENEAVAAAAGANSLSEAKNEKTETGLNKTFLKTTTKLPIDSGEVLVEQNALLRKTLKVLLNQTTIPAAGDNEKVNAKPNGLGGWDIEKIKTSLKAGLTVRTWDSESVGNEDAKAWQEKAPRYAWSTNSYDTKKLLGWYIYFFTATRSQIVTTTTTRTFSLDMPNASTATKATQKSDGSGTAYRNRVVPVSDGVWCVEKIVITKTAWSGFTSQAHLVGYISEE